MPTTTSEYAQQAQEQTLNAIRQSQQAVVEVVHAWAQAAEKAVPETPSIPYADELPSAKEVIQSSFDFAEQLLKAQREFAENLVAAAAPVIAKAQPKDS
jgi:hypothetical protein